MVTAALKNGTPQKANEPNGKLNHFVQPKLEINTPGDVYEQEADVMADKVMRMSSNSTPAKPITGLIGSSVQRKCASCEEEDKKKMPLMRKAEGGGYNASPSLASKLSNTKGGGTPLPGNTRNFMEHAFSTDFSRVRIHADGEATNMSKGISAKAFTHGSDIYFDSGQYNPQSPTGQHLLAHELTHVVQQGKGLRRLIQREENGGERRYTMQLGTEHIENATASEAIRAMKDFRNHLDISLSGDIEMHNDMIKLQNEHAIIAWVSNKVGGVEMPDRSIWNESTGLIASAKTALADGQVESAADLITKAGTSWRNAHNILYTFREGNISGAEKTVTGLEHVRDASALTVSVLATVTTGGLAGAAIGTGYTGAQSVAGQAAAVHYGLKDSIDWGGIAFDAVVGMVTSHLGGKLGGSIAAKIIGKNPAFASLGRQAVSRIVNHLVSGRASTVFHTTVRNLFDTLRGSPEAMNGEDFLNRLASELVDTNGMFRDMLTGELTHEMTSRSQARAAQNTQQNSSKSETSGPVHAEQSQTPAVETPTRTPAVEKTAATPTTELPVKQSVPKIEQAPVETLQEHAPSTLNNEASLTSGKVEEVKPTQENTSNSLLESTSNSTSVQNEHATLATGMSLSETDQQPAKVPVESNAEELSASRTNKQSAASASEASPVLSHEENNGLKEEASVNESLKGNSQHESSESKHLQGENHVVGNKTNLDNTEPATVGAPSSSVVGNLGLDTIKGISSSEKATLSGLSNESWAKVLDYAKTNKNVYSVKGKIAEELITASPQYSSTLENAISQAAKENIPSDAIKFVRNIEGQAPTQNSSGSYAELADGAIVAIQNCKIRILTVFESKSPSNRRDLGTRNGESLGQIGWDFERFSELPIRVEGQEFQPEQIIVSRTKTDWVGVLPPDFNLSKKQQSSIRQGFPGFRLTNGVVADKVLNEVATRLLKLTSE